MNGYMVFVNSAEGKAKSAGLTVPERGKKLGAAWRAMSVADKAKYNARATKRSSKPRRKSGSKPKRKSGSKAKRSRSGSKGKKRAASPGFRLFVAAKRREVGLKKATVKELKQIWKDLPAGERNLFVVDAKLAKRSRSASKGKKAKKAGSKAKKAGSKAKKSSRSKSPSKGKKGRKPKKSSRSKSPKKAKKTKKASSKGKK